MSLSADRVVAASMTTLRGFGLKPDEVPYGDTGKSSMELVVQAVAAALIEEITTNGVVKVQLDQGLAAWMGVGVPVPTDGGAALKTTLIAAAQGKAYDTATGAME